MKNKYVVEIGKNETKLMKEKIYKDGQRILYVRKLEGLYREPIKDNQKRIYLK